MTKLNALKNELAAWGKYCRGVEHNLAGKVRSPSAKIEEIGRVGVFAQGTGFLDQRSETMKVPDWVAGIDAQVNRLTPKMRTVIRAEYVLTGAVVIRARRIGLTVPAFRRAVSMALIDLLSE